MAPRVIIVGGGFAGLAAARTLARAPVDITLIDRHNHHLFQPLLYQVATAALAPGDISAPIRSILAGQENLSVRMGEVSRIDPGARQVWLGDQALSYDFLVLATGATHAYFGHDEWAERAPGLKTIGDALAIRRRILTAFEKAEWAEPAERERLLTFAVVGAGPTGVELAGAIAEIAMHTLKRDFRHVDTKRARVLLVEASDKVLGVYPENLRAKALRQLEELGVEVRLGRPVTDIDDTGLTIGEERIEAATVLWAAGVAASPLGEGVGERDRAGRVKVLPDLSVEGHPEVFVVGDLAHVPRGEGTVPGVAPAATQMGEHAAHNLRATLDGKPRTAFVYKDKGSMATIGRSRAIAWIGRLQVGGFTAWLLWVFVHLMFLVGHRNRLVVLLTWAWQWFTWKRAMRLIW
ncbi:MAG: NAD(P)/FAD-dependent oxidoreductase [Deltaproteobacteria bacterium]|nr:MAG: NAD(P)/FAD-dependent oxidoreductase [Deltaproteobacteria bacterium]